MNDPGEQKFQQLRNWVVAVDDEMAKGHPPDTATGIEAITALKIVLDWCENRMSIDARRDMARAIDRALGGNA